MELLITGAQSYVGTKVADYIQERHPEWTICQLDVRTDEWKEHDLSFYDAIYHVAGLAHRKITPDIEPLYYSVNRDLTIEIAKKAKECGVKQFVFMSTMGVYSYDETYVDYNTPTNPDNAYGKSKLEAENELKKLEDDQFIVAIVRPPMIYGKGCKGNYNSLRAIALNSPVFPKVNNHLSMLYIDNLAEFIMRVVEDHRSGTFYPQNAELVNTTEWVKYIAEEHGKNIYTSRLLGLLAELGKHIPGLKGYCIRAFGNSYYDPRMSVIERIEYQIIDFKSSIHATEN